MQLTELSSMFNGNPLQHIGQVINGVTAFISYYEANKSQESSKDAFIDAVISILESQKTTASTINPTPSSDIK